MNKNPGRGNRAHNIVDMESVKNYIRENWPLAVVVTIIYVIAIALFEAHLI